MAISTFNTGTVRVVLKLLASGLAIALIIRLGLTDIHLLKPAFYKSTNLAAPQLSLPLLLHVALGALLLCGLTASGMAILSLIPASRALSWIDHVLLGGVVGLPFWLACCVLVHLAGINDLVILLPTLGLPALRAKQISQHLRGLQTGWSWAQSKSHVLAIILIVLLSMDIGLLWRAPGAYGPGTVDLGDTTYYAAVYHSLKTSVWPLKALTVEGEFYSPPVNQIAPVLALAFDNIPGFDISLFLTASIAFFHLGATLYSGYLIFVYRQRLGYPAPKTSTILAFVFCICAATRYPSWVVESPPFAFSAPLCIALAYFVHRLRSHPSFSWILIPAAVFLFAITKIVVVAVMGTYTFCSVGLSALKGRLTNVISLGLIIGALTALAFSAAILAHFGPILYGFFEVYGFGPQSLQMLLNDVAIDSTKSVLPFVALDCGVLLLLLACWKLRDYTLLAAALIGVLLFWSFAFLFNATVAAAFVLAAFSIATFNETSGRKLGNPAIMLVIASGLVAFSHLWRDPGGAIFVITWYVTLGAALFLVLGSLFLGDVEKSTKSSRLTESWRWLLPCAAFYLVTSHVDGSLGFAGRRHTVVSQNLYDMWIKIRDLTPLDALIFTDQTGEKPDRLEGWNDLSAAATRQFYISSWSASPLRKYPAARAERLQTNAAVLHGDISPKELKLVGSYSAFFLAVQSDYAVSGKVERIYTNGEYTIYRLPD